MAILCCAQGLLANEERGRRISICSDSQTALRALDVPTVTSKLVWDCRCTLARDNEVTLVPGHSDIRGNEAPAIGISCNLGKGKIDCWLWDQPPGEEVECRQALLGDSPREGLASCNKISRLEAGLVSYILTGHGSLNYCSHKLGICMRPNCGKCDALEETSMCCDCPAYIKIRLKLEFAFPRPQQIEDLSVKRLFFSSGEE
ncbi:hypothetical protein ACFW04_006604 [Cataglyphis niger]